MCSCFRLQHGVSTGWTCRGRRTLAVSVLICSVPMDHPLHCVSCFVVVACCLFVYYVATTHKLLLMVEVKSIGGFDLLE